MLIVLWFNSLDHWLIGSGDRFWLICSKVHPPEHQTRSGVPTSMRVDLRDACGDLARCDRLACDAPNLWAIKKQSPFPPFVGILLEKH